LFASAIGLPLQSQAQSSSPDTFSHATYKIRRKADKPLQLKIKRSEAYLKSEGVYRVVPTYQLLRTASKAVDC
jgi:hypothetical protein